MKVYCIANQKGGTGKTTTAAALTAGLVKAGKNVLAIELDPQGNLAASMNHSKEKDKNNTLLKILSQGASLEPAIVHTNAGDIVPAGAGLNVGALEIRNYTALKACIAAMGAKYDYIIIDTPPQQGPLMINALTAAQAVIIPALAEPFSLEAIKALIGTIKEARKRFNKDLYIAGIVATRHNKRSILKRAALEGLEQIAKANKTNLYVIREGIQICEAQHEGQSIFDYAPRAGVTLDYKDMVKGILENG